MARLNLIIESDDDDELPDVSVLLANNPRGKKKEIFLETQTQTQTTKKKADGKVTTALVANPESRRRQRPLKLAHVNSLLLLPVVRDIRQDGGGFGPDDEASGIGTCEGRSPCEIQAENRVENRAEKASEDIVRKRSSPRKATQISSAHLYEQSQADGGLFVGGDTSSGENLSDFVVSRSESDVEAPPVRSPRKKAKEGFARESESRNKTLSSAHSVIDLLSPQANNSQHKRPETPPPGPSNENFDEDCLGRLRL